MRADLREDFPVLARQLDGRQICYLDSAATALKPRSVLAAEAAYNTQYTANIHRGKHALSDEASDAFERARRRVARHLNAEPASVVFVSNTTTALNLVARGLALRPEDGILAATCEHHSNLVPWMRAGRLTLLPGDPLRPLSLEQLAQALERHRPKVVTIGHASNVTGVIQPVAEICRLAREAGAVTVVDAAQSAPHLPLDVEALGCDFLAFSGHKLLAPTGVGVLFGRLERLEQLEPLVLGGGTVERVTSSGFTLKRLPYRLEAGTPPIAGAIGLAAALDYLEAVGFDAIQKHERALADALAKALAGVPGFRVLMAQDAQRLCIASLVPESRKVSPDQLALMLSDGFQIMVRSGFHCAHPCFDALGLETGSIRASAYLYNTTGELERFGAALRTLSERLLA